MPLWASANATRSTFVENFARKSLIARNLTGGSMGTTEQQTTLDRDFVEDFARRYEEAWASRDPDRLPELCAEDVVWHDPALREPLRGRDGVRRFVRESFVMAPDFHVESTDAPYIASTGPRVLQPYKMSGTMTGPWALLD